MHWPTDAMPQQAFRRMARTAVCSVGLSVALMIIAGVQGPSAAADSFPSAAPWPPWFTHSHPAPALVAAEVWLAVVLGGVGVVAGLLALRRGWCPRPRLLIVGSVAAVVSLMVIPPLSSSDALDYAAYGRIATLGHSPYIMTPGQLGATGDAVGAVAGRYYGSQPPRYGPLAIVSEAAASEIAGDSAARTIFWLKVWNGLAFLTLVLGLDRMLRLNGPRRARAHVLWSLNPVVLWAMMAGGHNDGLATVFGAAALFAMRKSSACTGLLSGVLLGVAITIKAPFVLFGLGLAWPARRSRRSLACLAIGAAAVVVPSYLLAGRAALTAIVGVASGVNWGFTIVYAMARVLHWHDANLRIDAVGYIGFAVLAVILLRRLPPGPKDFPAVRGTLALTLAWLIVSPEIEPWYYVMVFPLLAVTSASRLEWVVLANATFMGVAQLPRLFVGQQPEWLAAAARTGGNVLTPLALAGAGGVLLWLCLTNRWRSVELGPPTATHRVAAAIDGVG
jgi:hypothetical protein